jgi:hypothetical protein
VHRIPSSVLVGTYLSLTLTLSLPDSYQQLQLRHSAFFWLVSTLVGSFFWYYITPLRDVWFVVVPSQVLVQEAFRLAFYVLYHRLSSSSSSKPSSPLSAPSNSDSDTHSGFVPLTASRSVDLGQVVSSGVGFAVAQAAIVCGPLLWRSTGPASYYPDSLTCSLPLFALAGIEQLQLLHDQL